MNAHLYRFLLALTLFASHCSHGESLSVRPGFHIHQNQYLVDEATLTGPVATIELDSRQWRRQTQGWFSRGPLLSATVGQNHVQLRSQLPLLQWNLHQGLWLETHWQQQTLQADINESAVFLANDGSVTSVTAGSRVNQDHTLESYSAFWYESVKEEGPINLLGLHYRIESSPVSSRLSSTNATLFDGQFKGWGLTLGRIKDDRGLNFQWRLGLSQLQSGFSNDITQHQALAKAESTLYHLEMHLSWHYRYYLAPYWYLVPQYSIQLNSMLQAQASPTQVEHDAFIQTTLYSGIALQKRF